MKKINNVVYHKITVGDDKTLANIFAIDLGNGSRDLNLSFYFDKEIDENKNFGLKATVSDSGAISGAAFYEFKF